jgi:hypothetical protein
MQLNLFGVKSVYHSGKPIAKAGFPATAQEHRQVFFLKASANGAALATTAFATWGAAGMPTIPFWGSMTTKPIVDFSMASAFTLMRQTTASKCE